MTRLREPWQTLSTIAKMLTIQCRLIYPNQVCVTPIRRLIAAPDHLTASLASDDASVSNAGWCCLCTHHRNRAWLQRYGSYHIEVEVQRTKVRRLVWTSFTVITNTGAVELETLWSSLEKLHLTPIATQARSRMGRRA